jgi:addiction module RelE/StbE family toxin
MDKIEKVIWTYDGLNSLEEIVSFISKDSVYYASNFIKNVLTRIDNLLDFPNIGRVVPEYNNPNIREIIYQNYRIVYRIKEKTVYIVLISHGSKLLPSNMG